MESLENKIVQRYFRKVPAHPEGAIVHHGDCDVFSIKVCTCGLHHDLKGALPAFVDERYPKLLEEVADYERVREAMMHPTKSGRPKKKT